MFYKCLLWPLLCACVLICGSCSKDLLQWEQAVRVDAGTPQTLRRIMRFGESTIVACGGNRGVASVAVVSHDNGLTFQAFEFPGDSNELYGMGTGPDGSVYMCGRKGAMLKSSDAGSSFSRRQCVDWFPFQDVAFPTAERGIMIHDRNNNTGAICRIDSSGQLLEYMIVDEGLLDLEFPTPATGYISGVGILYKTNDGGNTWTTKGLRGDVFRAIYCPSENEIWACGGSGTIAHSTDGGDTWTYPRYGNNVMQKHYLLQDIYFPDPKHGYAVGDYGAVLYSNDSGKHWSQFEPFTNTMLTGITSGADSTMIICGHGGELWRVHIPG